jgi:hypothetical protein
MVAGVASVFRHWFYTKEKHTSNVFMTRDSFELGARKLGDSMAVLNGVISKRLFSGSEKDFSAR